MNILYPLLAGFFLLPYLGFSIIFIFTSCYMLLGIYAAKHLDCGIIV